MFTKPENDSNRHDWLGHLGLKKKKSGLNDFFFLKKKFFSPRNCLTCQVIKNCQGNLCAKQNQSRTVGQREKSKHLKYRPHYSFYNDNGKKKIGHLQQNEVAEHQKTL